MITLHTLLKSILFITAALHTSCARGALPNETPHRARSKSFDDADCNGNDNTFLILNRWPSLLSSSPTSRFRSSRDLNRFYRTPSQHPLVPLPPMKAFPKALSVPKTAGRHKATTPRALPCSNSKKHIFSSILRTFQQESKDFLQHLQTSKLSKENRQLDQKKKTEACIQILQLSSLDAQILHFKTREKIILHTILHTKKNSLKHQNIFAPLDPIPEEMHCMFEDTFKIPKKTYAKPS